MAMESESNPVTYRAHRPGDIGTIISRHGSIYCQEYGHDPQFEAAPARIGADFLEKYNPDKEQCLIAERNGEFLGCVMLVNEPESVGTARIRLLLVDPKARGLGIGRALVQRVLDFARSSGYGQVILYTDSALLRARKLYQSFGFQMTKELETRLFSFPFGDKSVGQMWELNLHST